MIEICCFCGKELTKDTHEVFFENDIIHFVCEGCNERESDIGEI
jgi:hypothetical protein